MNEKELRRLSRLELIAMLLEQKRENERLEAENKELRAQIEDRRLNCREAGSIAEASLRLNGVFEAAQKAADQYLENLRIIERKQKEMLEELQQKAGEQDPEMKTTTEGLADSSSSDQTERGQ